MKLNLTPKEWAAEFEGFVSAETVKPPDKISENIFKGVHADLYPALALVFAKLGLIQVLCGTFVLLFCPQFGISIIPGMGLMHFFMQFGEVVCMVGCGAVFLGASGLLAALILRPAEIRVVRRSRGLQLALMATLASGVFVCLGEELVLTLGAGWVMGALVGGLVSLELGWVLRSLKSRRG